MPNFHHEKTPCSKNRGFFINLRRAIGPPFLVLGWGFEMKFYFVANGSQ